MKPQLVWAVACVVVFSCQGQQLEEMFFSKPLGDRLQRLREYPLEDQYRIFRYGNDVIEPSLTDLAGPIAERGADAVPFLVRQLNSQPNDLTVMDVLLIFRTMASSKSYDVKGDSVLMDLLACKIAGMKSQKWQSICSRMFERVKYAK